MNTDQVNKETQPSKYISRIEFLKEVATKKSVLSLGCSSGRFIEDHIHQQSLLHVILHNQASELYGIDLDEDSLQLMREKLNYENLYHGNVEQLQDVPINKEFDVVIAGDILEHITCPGAMLEGVKRFLKPDGRIIISTNNAFGLHYQIKRWLGSYKEHFEHVSFFSPETLSHMFDRHGYNVTEMFGAYTRPPFSIKEKTLFAFGSPLFRIYPVLAGTLIVVASLNKQE